METLCIPVGPEEQYLRLAQIDNMASIYKGAYYSLLFDEELMSLEKQPGPAGIGEIDVYARLTCGIWMTRSWTLQECQLSHTLAVLFRDCIWCLSPGDGTDNILEYTVWLQRVVTQSVWYSGHHGSNLKVVEMMNMGFDRTKVMAAMRAALRDPNRLMPHPIHDRNSASQVMQKMGFGDKTVRSVMPLDDPDQAIEYLMNNIPAARRPRRGALTTAVVLAASIARITPAWPSSAASSSLEASEDVEANAQPKLEGCRAGAGVDRAPTASARSKGLKQASTCSSQAFDAVRPPDQDVSSDMNSGPTLERSECDRVQSALKQRKRAFEQLKTEFIRTFFAKNERTLAEDFVYTWDELAGRSTTMAEDIPLIMTNMLGVSNHGLVDLDNSGQMFHTILLSLHRIPISILFNTGPRQDANGNHHNRWVPSKISRVRLAQSPAYLGVRPTYLSYNYVPDAEDLNAGEHMVVCTSKSICSFSGKIYCVFSPSDHLRAIEPSVSIGDRFNTEEFSSMCFIFERVKAQGQVLWRGACCYVHDSAKPVLKTGKQIRDKVARPGKNEVRHLDLTFYCPIEVREIDAGEFPLSNATAMHVLNDITDPCELRIKYGILLPHHGWPTNANAGEDPLPGFKPLKHRTTVWAETQLVRQFLYLLNVCLFPWFTWTNTWEIAAEKRGEWEMDRKYGNTRRRRL
jgi:hypothetical protein